MVPGLRPAGSVGSSASACPYTPGHTHGSAQHCSHREHAHAHTSTCSHTSTKKEEPGANGQAEDCTAGCELRDAPVAPAPRSCQGISLESLEAPTPQDPTRIKSASTGT